MAYKHSNNNKNTKTRESPNSFLMQRKKRVSIADYGTVYIKKTQTQVRELYHSKMGRSRSYNFESQQPISSTSTDTNIVRANHEVNALNERIENEIDKLKNFRDCFLQDKQLKEESQKNSPAPEGTPRRRSRSLQCQRPPLAIRMVNSNNHHKSKSLVTEQRAKHHDRLDAGCSRCLNDNCSTPCSPNYPCGYCPCDPHHCYYDVYHLSNEQHQFVGNSHCWYPKAEPYTHCIEYPQQSCCYSPQYSQRCRTDLNTDEVCRYMQESARCIQPSRSSSPSRECKKSPGCRCTPDCGKIMTVTVKKHQQQHKANCATRRDSNAGPSKKEKIIISSNSTRKTQKSDSYCSETMRMHREYIEMYKKEHEKTAEKLSCQNVLDLVGKRTYIKLPTDPQNDQVQQSSYIKSDGTDQKSLRDLPQRAAAQQAQQQQQRQDWEECLSLYTTGRVSCNQLNLKKKEKSRHRCRASTRENFATGARNHQRDQSVQTQNQVQAKKKSNVRINVPSCSRDQDRVCQQQREADHESNLCLNARSLNKDQDQLCQKYSPSAVKRNMLVKVQKFIQNPIQCICPQDPTYNEATVLWNANRSCDTLESERDTGKVPGQCPLESPKKCVQYQNRCCGPDCPLLHVPSKISQYSQTTALASMRTFYVCSTSCREIPTQTDPPESLGSSAPVTVASTWNKQMPENVLHMLQEDYSDADIPKKCSEAQPEWSSRKIIHKLKRDYSDLDVAPAESTASVKALSKRTSSNRSQESRNSQRSQQQDCSDPPASGSTEPVTALSRWSASELFKEPRNIADESVQKIKIVYSTEMVMVNSKADFVSSRPSRCKIPPLPLKTSGQSSSDANRSSSPELEIGYYSPKNVTFDKSMESNVCGSHRSPIDWTQLNTVNQCQDCAIKYDDICEGDNQLNNTDCKHTEEF